MPNKILYLSNRRTASAIHVGNFIKGGISINERAWVREYAQPGVIIELRDGKTRRMLFSGNYAQVCQYLKRLNENQRQINSAISIFLDPEPPVGY
ncbi:MAG: hypothetical protein IJ249_04730 [Paludibacteraceae bacterium]|nr:hypothetical protein [Paludibacteraceae bacterium]